jgi:hypothetical protein
MQADTAFLPAAFVCAKMWSFGYLVSGGTLSLQITEAEGEPARGRSA